ncbi:hypothetical protein DPEC_G00364790 [Dallia pectoralis]|nr:hypothetical protein DPEC_G00364790 [Dallia pectoralis]
MPALTPQIDERTGLHDILKITRVMGSELAGQTITDGLVIPPRPTAYAEEPRASVPKGHGSEHTLHHQLTIAALARHHIRPQHTDSSRVPSASEPWKHALPEISGIGATEHSLAVAGSLEVPRWMVDESADGAPYLQTPERLQASIVAHEVMCAGLKIDLGSAIAAVCVLRSSTMSQETATMPPRVWHFPGKSTAAGPRAGSLEPLWMINELSQPTSNEGLICACA